MFRSVQEFLDDPDLTEAERDLIEACRAGEDCILGDLPPEVGDAPTVRAALIRLLALQATSLHEAGILLQGAVITGQLDLNFAKCRGRLVLDNCRFKEMPLLAQVKLAQLSLQRSHLPKGLFAQGAQVSGGVFLSNVEATGEVSLSGAGIGGQLACNGARFENAGGMALNAQRAEVSGGVFMSKVKVTGQVNLSGAGIGGQLNCEGARFENAGGMALNAEGVQVSRDVFLSKVRAIGQVSLSGAGTGGQLACDGARFENAGGDALNAQGVQVSGDVFLRGVTAMGQVCLAGAEIGGQLDCDGARFENAGGDALNAQGAQIKGGFLFREIALVKGQITLLSAHVTDLADDAASWDTCDQVLLDGFTYDRISGERAPKTFAKRRQWLAKGSQINGEFRPQPYTQFAKVMRAAGHVSEARKASKECIRLKAIEFRRPKDLLSRLAQPVHWLLDASLRLGMGYGYNPIRASFVGLCLLFMLATPLAWAAWQEGSFAPNSDVILVSPGWQDLLAKDCLPKPAPEGCTKRPAIVWSEDPQAGLDWDSFSALGYAADLVVPILDLGQTSAWAPSKDRGTWGWGLWWGRWVFAALGWLVTALGAAAVTGVIQRNSPD